MYEYSYADYIVSYLRVEKEKKVMKKKKRFSSSLQDFGVYVGGNI